MEPAAPAPLESTGEPSAVPAEPELPAEDSDVANAPDGVVVSEPDPSVVEPAPAPGAVEPVADPDPAPAPAVGGQDPVTAEEENLAVDVEANLEGLCRISAECVDEIVNEPKVVCAFRVEDVSAQNLYDGVAGIELRGRSSLEFDKKNYSFELRMADGVEENPANLMNMGKESDWILDGSWVDRSFMRNQLIADTFDALGGAHYGAQARYCTFVLNGAPQGLYRLGERVKRDDDRVDIAEDDGTGRSFVIKQDRSGVLNLRLGVEPSWQLLYPKQNTATEDQVAGVQAWLDGFGQALEDTTTSVFAYLDMATTVDWVLFQELSKNIDGYNLSVHLYRDAGGLAHLVPWDYDLGFGQPILEDEQNEAPSGWVRNRSSLALSVMTEPEFAAALEPRWHELRQGVLSDTAVADRLNSYQTLLDATTVAENFAIWPLEDVVFEPIYSPYALYPVTSYAEEVRLLSAWISERLSWMDTNVATLPSAENQGNTGSRRGQ
jgi:hypothetical protein